MSRVNAALLNERLSVLKKNLDNGRVPPPARLMEIWFLSKGGAAFTVRRLVERGMLTRLGKGYLIIAERYRD